MPIDVQSYPHILDKIVASADRTTGHNLRLANRHVKDQVDRQWAFHIVVSEDPDHWGTWRRRGNRQPHCLDLKHLEEETDDDNAGPANAIELDLLHDVINGQAGDGGGDTDNDADDEDDGDCDADEALDKPDDQDGELPRGHYENNISQPPAPESEPFDAGEHSQDHENENAITVDPWSWWSSEEGSNEPPDHLIVKTGVRCDPGRADKYDHHMPALYPWRGVLNGFPYRIRPRHQPGCLAHTRILDIHGELSIHVNRAVREHLGFSDAGLKDKDKVTNNNVYMVRCLPNSSGNLTRRLPAHPKVLVIRPRPDHGWTNEATNRRARMMIAAEGRRSGRRIQRIVYDLRWLSRLDLTPLFHTERWDHWDPDEVVYSFANNEQVEWDPLSTEGAIILEKKAYAVSSEDDEKFYQCCNLDDLCNLVANSLESSTVWVVDLPKVAHYWLGFELEATVETIKAKLVDELMELELAKPSWADSTAKERQDFVDRFHDNVANRLHCVDLDEYRRVRAAESRVEGFDIVDYELYQEYGYIDYHRQEFDLDVTSSEDYGTGGRKWPNWTDEDYRKELQRKYNIW